MQGPRQPELLQQSWCIEQPSAWMLYIAHGKRAARLADMATELQQHTRAYISGTVERVQVGHPAQP